MLPSTGERLLTEAFDQYTVEHLHRYAFAMELCKNRDVVDIASGEGYGSNLLANRAKNVTGIDISKDAVEHASAKYIRTNLQYLQGAADSIPLGAASVDIVVSFETLEHHDKHDEMFLEIKRILRPGGVLLMSTPEKLFYTDLPNVQNEFHVKELYLEEFRDLARRHFKNVDIFFQRAIYGSLVVSEQEREGFTHYRGTYASIESAASIYQPHYNVCLASDSDLPQLSHSVFDGTRVFDEYKKNAEEYRTSLPQLEARVRGLTAELEHLRHSRSYQLGHLLTWPLMKILGEKRFP